MVKNSEWLASCRKWLASGAAVVKLSCKRLALSCQVRLGLVLQNDVQSVDDTGNVT